MKKARIGIPRQEFGDIKTFCPPDSIYINGDEFSSGSKNFDTDITGTITKRKGGTQYLNSGSFQDQFEAIFSDGVRHMLLMSGGTLKYTNGDGNANTVTAGYSANGFMEFILFLDRVYFGNGIDNAQVYDKQTVYGGVTYTAPKTKQMGCLVPSSAPTTAVVAGGVLPVQSYTYKVTFLYYGFEESNGSIASSITTTSSGNQKINLTAIPVGGYGVTARKIYRDENDGNWLLIKTITNNTATTYSDDGSLDATTPIPFDNGLPPTFSLITINGDYVWVAGVPGSLSTAFFCSPGSPDIWPGANFLPCNQNDRITALVVYQGRVIVFNRNSMGQILGTTPSSFRYVPIPTASIGCVDNRSVQVRVLNGVPYLVWLSDHGLYSFNGNSISYIGKSIEDLLTVSIQQSTGFRGSFTQNTEPAWEQDTNTESIDTTTDPGILETINPKFSASLASEWKAAGFVGSNLVTEFGNDIRIPIAKTYVPASEGTLSGLTTDGSGNLILSPYSDFTGEVTSGSISYQNCAVHSLYQPFIPTKPGHVTSFQMNIVMGNVNGDIHAGIWANDTATGKPGATLWLGSVHPGALANTAYNVSVTPSVINLVAGTKYWYGLYVVDAGGAGSGFHQIQGSTTVFLSGGVMASSASPDPGNPSLEDFFATVDASSPGYVFLSDAVAATGTYTGPTYDTGSLSIAGQGSVQVTTVIAAGETITLYVDASNDSSMSTGVITDTFSLVNGVNTLVTNATHEFDNLRYYRIRIVLATTNARNTPTCNTSIILGFNPNAYWISPSIHATTDNTGFASIVAAYSGFGVLSLLTATSTDNITYSSFHPGLTGTDPWIKIKIQMTDATLLTTPTITQILLKWAVTGTSTSIPINTGATPGQWNVFQAIVLLNGGTASFAVRSASTQIGLAAQSWTAITIGQIPSISVNPWVQWKIVLGATADHVPQIGGVTLNWGTTPVRCASIFWNNRYYLAVASFAHAYDDTVIVLDQFNKIRIYKDLAIGCMSLFFFDFYYGTANNQGVIQFNSANSDEGVAIELNIITKAFSLEVGEDWWTKWPRYFYLSGFNTGCTYDVSYSVDQGVTWIVMIDSDLGGLTWTSSGDGSKFTKRFEPVFDEMQLGRTVMFKVHSNDILPCQVESMIAEIWARNMQPVQPF